MLKARKALLSLLDLDVGIEDQRNDGALILLQHDNASHYFTNNYKMRLELLQEAREQLFTNDSRFWYYLSSINGFPYLLEYT